MLELFHWIGHTSLGEALRQSTWAFATIEIIHLLALALFGGSVLLIDLRFWGVGIKTEPVAKVLHALSPQLIASLTVMVITGTLMVISGPMRYYYNDAFRLKMVLLFAGVLVQFLLHKIAVRPRFDSSGWRKVAAGSSLILWLGVALAGRVIGYL